METPKAFNILVGLLINIVLWTIPVSPRLPLLKRDPFIEQYFLVCGFDYLCDSSSWSTYIRPRYEYREVTNQCPECFCDDKCLSRGDCCPDLYFSLPNQTCTSVTIMNYTQDYEIEPGTSHYSIVNGCPPGSDPNITSKCMADMTDIEKMNTPVVTSRAFPLTYKNRYCAECNDEHVDSLYVWPLGIDCVFFADFNFLSSYTEIVNQVKERFCYVRYTPPKPELVRGCLQDTRPRVSIVDRCNQTGTWDTYDLAIEQACESMYTVSYRLYKNIFCYMCNPPKVLTQKTIDVCNETGQWFPDDNHLNLMCLFEDISPYTRPFKNIFCYLCNKINTKNLSFIEAETNISEFVSTTTVSQHNDNMTSRDTVYVYEININSIRYNYMVDFYSRMGMNDVTNHSRFILNVTHLAYQFFATFPAGDLFCRDDRVPLQTILNSARTGPCSCEDNCMFYAKSQCNYFPCCEDTGYELHTKCIGRRGMAKTRIPLDFRYLVVNGCQSYFSNSMIRDRCEKTRPSDLLSYLPLTDKTSNVQYANTDCYVCREIVKLAYGSSVEDTFIRLGQNHLYAVPWNVRITCPTILETKHHVYVYNVIKLADELGCIVDLIPYTNDDDLTPDVNGDMPLDDSDTTPNDHGVEPHYSGDFSNDYHTNNKLKWTPTVCRDISQPRPGWGECNVTGYWRTEDPDIRYACENTSYGQLMEYRSYKNMYCYICNPRDPFEENVISTCNAKIANTDVDPYLQYACEHFPRISNRIFYKNIFCEKCHMIGRTDFPGFKTPDGSVFNFDYRYREHESEVNEPMYVMTYRNMFSLAKYDEDGELDNSQGCGPTQIYDANLVSKLNGELDNSQGCGPTQIYDGHLMSKLLS